MISDSEIDAIRARLSAATPGRWGTMPHPFVAQIPAPHTHYLHGPEHIGTSVDIGDFYEFAAWAQNDAEFIAYAPDDIATLLADRVALLTRVQVLEDALQHAESHLSLLRHRGDIAWGTLGIGDAYDYDQVIGRARRVLYDSITPQAPRSAAPSHP